MPRSAELTQDAAAPIEVVVGIVIDSDGKVLIGQRPEGRYMAGFWEFPGGKLEPGESVISGLTRELQEELGIVVLAAEPLLDLHHSYPDLSVRLDVWWVTSWSGRLMPCDGQQLRWIEPAVLAGFPMLPADGPIVRAVCARLGQS